MSQRRPPLIVALLAVFLLVAAAPVPLQQDNSEPTTAHSVWETRLATAATERGIAIQTDHLFTMERDGGVIAAAVIDGFENVPATALSGGVDFGFAYIDAPASGVRPGYYTLRARGQDPILGENQIRVDLVDDRGLVADTLDAVADVWSLTVPADPPAARTIVGGVGDTTPDFDFFYFGIWFSCPNGMTICFEILVVSFVDNF